MMGIIEKQGTMNVKAVVSTALKELEDAGMFIKTQLHKEDGSFDGYKYILKW